MTGGGPTEEANCEDLEKVPMGMIQKDYFKSARNYLPKRKHY